MWTVGVYAFLITSHTGYTLSSCGVFDMLTRGRVRTAVSSCRRGNARNAWRMSCVGHVTETESHRCLCLVYAQLKCIDDLAASLPLLFSLPSAVLLVVLAQHCLVPQASLSRLKFVVALCKSHSLETSALLSPLYVDQVADLWPAALA